jgi:tetratricopeptide (TPR) repeat protein
MRVEAGRVMQQDATQRSVRDPRLVRAVALREAGDTEEARTILLSLAREFPDDAEVQYQTGWTHDQLGLEEQAVPYYERALMLGLPDPEREGLVLGLGSTYRNVGRLEESVALLQNGVDDYPGNAALRCFLALSRLSNDEPAEALALALDVVLATSGSPEIDRYRRALSWYRDDLRGLAVDD